MISPFTGGHATLKHEKRELEYRKEKYSYIAQFYEDDETHEQFTTTEMDEANILQVYNQYRMNHSIPFVDEIAALRKGYGLSASKMSVILGFGVNQYRQYEEGYMPTETNGKILKACQNPIIFETFVENSRQQLVEKEYTKIMVKVKEKKEYDAIMDARQSLIFSGYTRNIHNGFAPQSLERLHNILLFFINKCDGVFNTKMNKLLFYLDFYNYRQHGQAVSGLTYRAIQFGPVPVKWDRVYSLFDDVQQNLIEFNNGISGTQLTSCIKPDLSLFTIKEIESLEKVSDLFLNTSSKEISMISHDEHAWKMFVNTGHIINFNAAFKLKFI